MTTAKVIFIPVRENPAKLQAIISIANHYFTSGVRLLICVSSDEVARYVDELLWKHPPESFLPHAIISRPTNEAIAITTSLSNLNNATILFNLRPEANELASTVSITYEFFDETHFAKQEQSRNRHKTYQNKGMLIEIMDSMNSMNSIFI